MPLWRRKPHPLQLEQARRFRPEYMTVRDIAAHPGTSGYVRIEHSARGGLTGFAIGSTTPSSIGRSPEGQPWITQSGTVTITPVDGLPWAHVDHIPNIGLTVHLPDQWGNYVTLLADSPPNQWIPAAPGKAPEETPLRGISAPDDTTEQ